MPVGNIDFRLFSVLATPDEREAPHGKPSLLVANDAVVKTRTRRRGLFPERSKFLYLSVSLARSLRVARVNYVVAWLHRRLKLVEAPTERRGDRRERCTRTPEVRILVTLGYEVSSAAIANRTRCV